MKKKEKKEEGCCSGSSSQLEPFAVDAIVTIDPRGQIVLPKDVRDKMGITTGDKLAVISHKKGDNYCCMTLMKADLFLDSVRKVLGPMMKELIQSDRES